MRHSVIVLLVWTAFSMDCGVSLPLKESFLHSLLLQRLKRGSPTGNVYDPPLPVFPSKENAPFWNPAPYPIPTTLAPPAAARRKLPYYDPNNPYLDTLTEPYFPNLGLGYANQRPTLVGGGLNWPTGNMLMPSDHFNGTLGWARPQQLRVGMQGGPLYPYQSPQFIKTASDINDAAMLQQVTQVQSDAGKAKSAGNGQQVPSGFIPVQQHLLDSSLNPPQQGAPLQQQVPPLQQPSSAVQQPSPAVQQPPSAVQSPVQQQPSPQSQQPAAGPRRHLSFANPNSAR